MHPSIQSTLLQAKQALQTISASPQLDAEILLANILQINRAQLIARFDQILTSVEQERFLQLLAKRKLGEPIAYIIGYREFWSLEFAVTPATLIPRPETELLIEVALEKLPANQSINIAELGTGCGAIALALAHERPQWNIIATDKSIAALDVARNNAKRLGITNVSFRQGDWCAALNAERFAAIVSNPPYIADNDAHLQQAELSFEPIKALVSAENGLCDLRQIIATAREHLLIDGWLMLEHGYDQSDLVKNIFLSHHYQKVADYTDFTGVKRIAVGKF